MKRTVSISLVVFLVTQCYSLRASAQDLPYKEGTVWDIAFVSTKPGMKNDYLKSLAANWRRIHEEAKKQGLILSYRILSGAAANEKDWDVMLMTEYKDMAALDGFEEKWGALQSRIFGSQQDVTTIYTKQGEMRKILGEKTVREVILK